MGRTEVRADFSGALSAIVVIALIMATTAVMLVTLNTARAAAESTTGSCRVSGEISPPCVAKTGDAISLNLLAK